MKTHHILWHLIWVCTVCIQPIKKMLGLHRKICRDKFAYFGKYYFSVDNLAIKFVFRISGVYLLFKVTFIIYEKSVRI